MHRVVLDRECLVAALATRRGASHRLLRAAAAGTVVPLVSSLLWRDYGAAASALRGLAEGVTVPRWWRATQRDVASEGLVAVAVVGGADALVTPHPHHFARAVRRFGLVVLTPGDFLTVFDVEP